MPTSNGAHAPTEPKSAYRVDWNAWLGEPPPTPNPSPDPVKPPMAVKRTASTRHSTLVQAATFIAACLAVEGVIDLDMSSAPSIERYTWAIDMIAVCIKQLVPDGADCYVLPFDHKPDYNS